jgi:hypothetical protein
VRDLRDPEALGKMILERPDKKMSAHEAADKLPILRINLSQNGSQRDP